MNTGLLWMGGLGIASLIGLGAALFLNGKDEKALAKLMKEHEASLDTIAKDISGGVFDDQK